MRKAFIVFAALVICGVIVTASAHEANREPVFKIFGIAEPSLLPDSNFYFFKELGRGFRRFFTFDAVKKAELELEIADEKLAELEKVAAKSEASEDAIKDAFENYLEAQERLARRLESLKGENKNVDTLLAKLADRVIEHEELFNALEDEFTEEETEKATKEIAKAVKKALELDEKKFKEKLKEKIKEETDDLEDMDALEEIDDLLGGELDDELGDLAEEINRELEDKAFQKSQCGPQPGAPGNWICRDKKWQLVEDKPREPIVCTQQYDPVCGTDGKTYSNECFATTVGVVIKHDGTCQESKINVIEPTISTDKSEYKHGDTISYTTHNNSGSNIFVLGGQNNLDYVEKKNTDGTWTRYGLTKLPQAPSPPGTDPYVTIPPKESRTFNRWVGWLINIQNDQTLDIVPGTYRLIIFYVTSKQLPGFSEALSSEFQMKTGEPNAQEFKLEADDYGFYPSNTLSVAKETKVKITFTVRATSVYYGGLDFRSSKFSSKSAKPGESVEVEFTTDEPFVITSYWPLSGVKKAEMRIEVK